MNVLHRRNVSLGDLLCEATSWFIGFFLLGCAVAFLAALLRGVAFIIAGV